MCSVVQSIVSVRVMQCSAVLCMCISVQVQLFKKKGFPSFSPWYYVSALCAEQSLQSSLPCADQSLHCSHPCAEQCLDGINADFSLHMEGSHADFALLMEWRHSFNVQIIAKTASFANFLRELFKSTNILGVYRTYVTPFENKNIFSERTFRLHICFRNHANVRLGVIYSFGFLQQKRD